jgi:hypothetical protein
MSGLSGNLFDVYLRPYFLEAYRPVRKGESTFTTSADFRRRIPGPWWYEDSRLQGRRS